MKTYNVCSSAGIFISNRKSRLTREAILTDKFSWYLSKPWIPKASTMGPKERNEYFPKHDK